MSPPPPLLSLLLLIIISSSSAGAQEQNQDQKEASLCVMTFNLRYASDRPPNAWPQRRPVMKELIQRTDPDLIGTQEGLYQQIKDIHSDLPMYDWIGLGREGGSRGEFMAVFYKKDRFEPVEFDHFWLSDTPDVIGSTTWGNKNRRMVTWVRFEDRSSKQQFYFFNTHFDHETPPAREKSAELIVKRIDELKTKLPVILVGDFNAPAQKSKPYETITAAGLADAYLAAKQRRGDDVGTFHNYRPATPGGPRIDWILTRGDVTVDAAETVTFSKDDQFPSDHFPVAAWLKLLAKPEPLSAAPSSVSQSAPAR